MKSYLYRIAIDKENGMLAELLKWILWLCSSLYILAVRIRNSLYKVGLFKSTKLAKPVISVGNLSWGGVGKTPLVEWIASKLKDQSVKPAILTRGYMSEKGSESDEALMLKRSLNNVPVLIGPNRIANAVDFQKNNEVDIFLMDDGFQHQKLARDLNILVMDATNPLGNGHYIPRGILREPLEAVKRADLIVLTKTDLNPQSGEDIIKRIERINNVPVIKTIHKPQKLMDIRTLKPLDLNQLKGRRVCIFSSIGDPESFKKIIGNLGPEVAQQISFMDHHQYVEDDINNIKKICKEQNVDFSVTTEKDAVKLDPFLKLFDEQAPIVSLKIQIEIQDGEEVFVERINHLLQR